MNTLRATETCERKLTINPYYATEFQTELEKINVKLSKLGANISAKFEDPYRVNVAQIGEDPIWVERQDVALEVPILQVAGWNFVAKIERAGSEVLTSMAPAHHGEDLGPREWDFCRCDHCSHRRHRNTVFLLRNAQGEEQQVGSTCLQSFFGVDPSKTLSAWDVFRAFQARLDADEFGFGEGRARGFILSHFAGFVARSIRIDGWLSKGAAYEKGGTATSTMALNDAFPAPGVRRPEVEEQDWDTAHKAILWAESLDPSVGNDYERNIGALARAGWVPYGKEGLAASIVGVYLRNQAKAAEEAEAAKNSVPSTWFGVEGKRERKFKAKLVSFRSFESFYGARVLNRFVTDSGQVLIWWTNAAAGDEGETLLLDGTVKKHEVYRDEKQTVLSRCKVH